MKTDKIKKDLQTFSEKDLQTLYNYYKVDNLDDLIPKIYLFSRKGAKLPSGLMEAIEKQDFEAFKKICDSVANPKSDGSGFNDPEEGYEIFKTVQFSDASHLDANVKSEWLKYLVEEKEKYPHQKHKLALNGDKIMLDKDMNISLILTIRPSSHYEHKKLNIDELNMLFNRVLDHLNYPKEVYDMIDLIIRFSGMGQWGDIVKNPIEMIEKLKSKYPNVNLHSWKGTVAYNDDHLGRLVIWTNKKDLILYFLKDVSSDEKAELLFDTKNVDIIKLLIENGVDINVKRHGKPFLMYILENSWGYYHIEKIIGLLHSTGKLDLEAEDNEGRTALFKAAGSHGDNKIFEMLINYGANINHQSKNGVTVLMITAAFSLLDPQDKNFETLMKYKDKLDFNLKTKMGNTALLSCETDTTFINEKPSLEAIKKLIKYTDLNIQNNDGNTILHLAFDNRIVSACLYQASDIPKEDRANPNIVNNKGETPLSININGMKNSDSRSRKIYIQNIVDLINAGADIDKLEIQDLLPFYKYVVPNLEKKINDIVAKFNKIEKVRFEEKCPKESYFKKETMEVDNIKHLQKCLHVAQEMIKYKPGEDFETGKAQQYKSHPYFQPKTKI